jgi:hypothetical protein
MTKTAKTPKTVKATKEEAKPVFAVQRDKSYDDPIKGGETHLALGISEERCDELARKGVDLILKYTCGEIGLAQAMEQACEGCNANEIAFQCLGMGRSMENPMTHECAMIKQLAASLGGRKRR